MNRDAWAAAMLLAAIAKFGDVDRELDKLGAKEPAGRDDSLPPLLNFWLAAFEIVVSKLYSAKEI